MNALSSTLRAEQVHADLLAAVRARHPADHAAAVLLAEVDRDRLYRAFGHVSTVAYAEAELGMPQRRARALLQLGRTAASLPGLDAAFAAGLVPYTKARELLRVVTPETEAAWVARAAEVDSRTLERLVADAVVGDEPPPAEAAPKGPARVRIVIECEAHEAALIRDGMAAERVATGVRRDEVGDGALLAAMAQRALHADQRDGVITAERFRAVVEVCPSCARVEGRDHEVTETTADLACCDAEVVDLRPGAERGRLTRTVPPKVRRAVLHRDRERCVVPGCACRLFVDVHHLRARADGGRHAEGNLVTLCPAHHRLVHEGLLAVERVDGRIEVRSATHVGRHAGQTGSTHRQGAQPAADAEAPPRRRTARSADPPHVAARR